MFYYIIISRKVFITGSAVLLATQTPHKCNYRVWGHSQISWMILEISRLKWKKYRGVLCANYRHWVYCDHIQHDSAHTTIITMAKRKSDLALKNDTPYLALTGEMWVFLCVLQWKTTAIYRKRFVPSNSNKRCIHVDTLSIFLPTEQSHPTPMFVLLFMNHHIKSGSKFIRQNVVTFKYIKAWTTSPVFCIQHYPTVFVGRKSLIFTLTLPKYVFNIQINNKLTVMACQRHITYQTILTHLHYACEPVLHHEVPRILLLLFMFKRSFKSRRFHFTFPAAKEENQSISVPTREMIRITFVNHCNLF